MNKKILKVSSKGHIILPKKVRDDLFIKEGSYVEIQVEGNLIKVLPARSTAEELAGVLKGVAKKPMDLKSVRKRVAEEVAKDIAKGLKSHRR